MLLEQRPKLLNPQDLQLEATNGIHAENEIVTLTFPDGKTTCQASGKTKRFVGALINAKKTGRIFSRLLLCFDVYPGIPFSEASQNLDYFVDSVRDELRDKIGPWKILTIPDKQDPRRLKNNRLKTYTLKNKDEERSPLILPNGQKIFNIESMPKKVLEMIMEGNPEGKPINSDELLELFRKVFDYSTISHKLKDIIRYLRRRLVKSGYTIKITPASEEKTEELRDLYFYTLEEQKMPALSTTKPVDSKQIEPGIKKENTAPIIAGVEREIARMILSYIRKGELKKVVATPRTFLQMFIPKGLSFESLFKFDSEEELNQYFVDTIMKTVNRLWDIDSLNSLPIKDIQSRGILIMLKSVGYTKENIGMLIRTRFKIRPPTLAESAS